MRAACVLSQYIRLIIMYQMRAWEKSQSRRTADDSRTMVRLYYRFNKFFFRIKIQSFLNKYETSKVEFFNYIALTDTTFFLIYLIEIFNV